LNFPLEQISDVNFTDVPAFRETEKHISEADNKMKAQKYALENE
jgi:hypothetical protein